MKEEYNAYLDKVLEKPEDSKMKRQIDDRDKQNELQEKRRGALLASNVAEKDIRKAAQLVNNAQRFIKATRFKGDTDEIKGL